MQHTTKKEKYRIKNRPVNNNISHRVLHPD